MSPTRRGLVTVLLLGGCASTASHETAAHMDVYFAAARQCERQNLTVHLERVFPNGDLTVMLDADSRSEVARFTACYHEGIRRNIEALRRAGKPLPESMNLHPEIDTD